MSGELALWQQEAALRVVAEWMGGLMSDDGKPCPTGVEAYRSGRGPMLVSEWDWPDDGPTPALVLEGGVTDWAIRASSDLLVCDRMAEFGVWCEPYASWALLLYSDDVL